MSSYVEVLPPGAPRDQWLTARRQGIGSSDIAAIAGQSTWASPYSVWCDKQGMLPETEPSEAMRWGTLLEPVILTEWSRRTSTPIRRVGLARSTDREWQQATPDAMCECATPGVVETKCDAGWDPDQWADTIPLKYLLQVTWQMDTLGVDHGHLAVLLSGNEMRTYDVPLDPEIVGLLRERASAFWTNHVLPRVPPAVDASDVTTAAIKARWGVNEGTSVVLDHGWLDRLDEREQHKTLLKQTQESCVLTENQLREAMGEATEAVCLGQVVATHRPRRDGVRVLRVIEAAKRKELAS